jgi:hypothetical protein
MDRPRDRRLVAGSFLLVQPYSVAYETGQQKDGTKAETFQRCLKPPLSTRILLDFKIVVLL